jgi:phage host-nuclease inhibitor protein Gam
MPTTIKRIESISDLESSMNRLQGIDAEIKREEAALSSKIAVDREQMNNRIGPICEERVRIQNMIEEFAIGHKSDPEIFPAGKKSLVLTAGTIGFKLGPLSIALKKGTKTEKVLEAAKRLRLKIIRTPDPELDKAAVKDLVEDGTIDDAILKDLGLVVNQSETLTIKLNDL